MFELALLMATPLQNDPLENLSNLLLANVDCLTDNKEETMLRPPLRSENEVFERVPFRMLDNAICRRLLLNTEDLIESVVIPSKTALKQLETLRPLI